MEDVIASGDLSAGAADNPGALKASYAGQLQGVHESSGIGGTFSFDVNLGSGGIDNGKMDIGTNAVPNTYSGTNGTGQVIGGIFNVGDFTASPDSMYPTPMPPCMAASVMVMCPWINGKSRTHQYRGSRAWIRVLSAGRAVATE